MTKKLMTWKTKGMNRDLSVSAFNPEFSFENLNLRLSTNDGNTLMSWVNEKGTTPVMDAEDTTKELELNGCAIGTAIINRYLILFLAKGWEKDEEDEEDEGQYFDYIYRLEYSNADKVNMIATQLYKGHLNFHIENPIETLVSYESEHIQKVYWTDGINQPRLINVAPDNDGKIKHYRDTSFDFISTLQLNETIKVQKILGGGGMFAPGVIQYCFTYYNKYGQESNIFYTTPLYYISHQDRGGSPEDKIDNAFKITVTGVDANFDYLRIYSVQRTNINGTPICKRLQDIEISSLTNSTASYIDMGLNGDSIDPTELLYKGGNSIMVGTMEQKDNTLFMGDITTPRNERPSVSGITLATSTRKFFPLVASKGNYEYASQLTSVKPSANNVDVPSDESVPCAGFKYGDIYRCGVQFQDETGRWTDPILIGDKEVKTEAGASDIHPVVPANVTPEIDRHVDFEITITNSSAYPITFTSEVYLAIEKGGVQALMRVVLKDGNTDFATYTLAVSDSKQFAAVAERGTEYLSGEFITDASDLAQLGVASNAIVNDAGSSNPLVTGNISGGSTFTNGGSYTIECTSSPDPTPQPDPDPDPSNYNARFKASYDTCIQTPQPPQVDPFDHNPTNDNPGTFTFVIRNDSGKRLMWNGKFSFFTTDGEERYGHYREPSKVDNGEHWYYCNPSNYIFEKNANITISVPIKRTLPDGSTQDLTGKSLMTVGTYRLYFSKVANTNYLSNSAEQIVDPSDLTDTAIADGKTFTVRVTRNLTESFSYYVDDAFDYYESMAYFSHTRGSGEIILIPMRLSDWASYTSVRNIASNSNTRNLTRGAGDYEETEQEETEEHVATRDAVGTTYETPYIKVPVIKGTIPAALASTLIGKGYKKARAVVVYPEIQDRKVICQGVVCPTLYTDNHRMRDSGESTGDLFAQSSWFFRPWGEANYCNDANAPLSGQGATIEYMDNSLSVSCSPQHIKRVEIQGHYEMGNKFRSSWATLTFHSPDIEFDDNLANLDYSASFNYSRVGEAAFSRTMSDIDIQTETPTISDSGLGFVKKSFVKNNARGIISGLFWDDFEIDDTGSEDNLQMFRPLVHQNSSMKWMVYLWNRTGSLNNDIDRPANYGVASAILKKKIISNLRFTNTNWGIVADGKTYNSHLFNSNQAEILKLDIGDTGLNYYANIYMGNVDTMLISDKPDGMYFALPPNVLVNLPYESPSFNSDVVWKTFDQDGDDNHGNYWFSNTDGWKQVSGEDTPGYEFTHSVGDIYKDIVLKKSSIRMKYKSTPHLVMVMRGDGYIGDTTQYAVNANTLPILELQRTIDPNTIFGGTSMDAQKANVWIPCGEPVRLDNLVNIGTEQSPNIVVQFEYSWGDTYYQRWDCLKTYAFTPEDINQVVEIGSFMLETHVNIDGRYDRNRGQLSNLYMSPQNFNLINPVYSQLNNFFTYRIQDSDAYNEKYFPNLITWSKTKTFGADVDLWTNVTLASTLEMDGDKGKVRKLIRLNDQLLSFQDKGISQILYNENVQISATDGVPIEIANSGKVQGKRYISDSIGCSNKWSMAQTPSGIYFMDSINKAIFMFNGQLNNLSAALGMNTWCKNNIPDVDTIWTPADYMSDNGTSGGEPIDGFMNFVTYYDKLNQDVLFINKNTALAYSERLGVFTSFYDYGNSPYLCNLNDTGVWTRIAAELDVEDPDTVPHDEYSTSLWKHQAGDYCNFFGINKPFWMTLIGNPEPQADKIFTNLEFRACVDGEGVLGNDGKFTPTTPFDYLETWNEYQHGYTSLSIKNGHNLFKHGGDSSALIRKFRIWRNDIPRNNCLLDSERIAGTEYPYQTDESLNVSRYIRKPSDRMRNPWIYLKLEKTSQENMPKSEVHDIKMSYFT